VFNATCLMTLGRGLCGRGFYNVVGQDGGVKREADCLYINENLDFLLIKFSNMKSSKRVGLTHSFKNRNS